MRIAFVFGFLCVAVTSFAQQDFRHGFIVTNKLDTLVGFVNFKQSGSAYKTCSFKESENQIAVHHKPFEIVGYGFQVIAHLKRKLFQILITRSILCFWK